MRAVGALCLLAGCAGSLDAATQTIENKVLAVMFDDAAGTFTVAEKPTGKIFLTDGRLENGGGTAAVMPVKHKTFGEGQAIEIIHPNGNRDRITLC